MEGWAGGEKVVWYVDDKNVGRVVRLARHQMVCVDMKEKRHYLQNSRHWWLVGTGQILM